MTSKYNLKKTWKDRSTNWLGNITRVLQLLRGKRRNAQF